jgi:hypothetical protein
MFEADRDKLIKCLRMFSSSFDGEIASAARRAHELISARKLDWDDLIVKPGREHGASQAGFQHRGRQHYQQQNDDTADTLADIRRCQELEDHLTGWEIQFVNSIADSIIRWRRLTEKQQASLDRIVEKLKLSGLWEYAAW